MVLIFSSHAGSLHEDEMGNGFKMYTNALYDENPEDDKSIFWQNFQRRSLHGVINPLFEEDMEGLDLANDVFNDDTLSYYCKRSDLSSSKCDGESIDEIASYEIDNKVFDKVVVENQHAPYSKFYDEYSNVITSPIANFKESLKTPY